MSESKERQEKGCQIEHYIVRHKTEGYIKTQMIKSNKVNKAVFNRVEYGTYMKLVKNCGC